MDGTMILLVAAVVMFGVIAFDQRRKLLKLREGTKEVELNLVDISAHLETMSSMCADTLSEIRAESGRLETVSGEIAKAAVVLSGRASQRDDLISRADTLIGHRELLDRRVEEIHTQLLETVSDVASFHDQDVSLGGR